MLVASCFAGVTQAENLRCGNQLVTQGQTRLEVRAKCGDPGDIAHSTLVRSSGLDRRNNLRRAVRSVEETVIVEAEDWIYNFGPHRLMCRLRFVNGILESVQTMGYGFNY